MQRISFPLVMAVVVGAVCGCSWLQFSQPVESKTGLPPVPGKKGKLCAAYASGLPDGLGSLNPQRCFGNTFIEGQIGYQDYPARQAGDERGDFWLNKEGGMVVLRSPGLGQQTFEFLPAPVKLRRWVDSDDETFQLRQGGACMGEAAGSVRPVPEDKCYYFKFYLEGAPEAMDIKPLLGQPSPAPQPGAATE